MHSQVYVSAGMRAYHQSTFGPFCVVFEYEYTQKLHKIDAVVLPGTVANTTFYIGPLTQKVIANVEEVPLTSCFLITVICLS